MQKFKYMYAGGGTYTHPTAHVECKREMLVTRPLTAMVAHRRSVILINEIQGTPDSSRGLFDMWLFTVCTPL